MLNIHKYLTLMNDGIKKVKLLQMMPHKVLVQFVDTGRTCEFPRRSFMRRLDLGLLELVNPEAIPSVL